jgi:acyl-CoA synthetase (AMP-forming)/AMP-acid ligase II
MHNESCKSLVHVLVDRASRNEHRCVYHALDANLSIKKSLSYGDLYCRAKQIACWLSAEAKAGGKVALLFDCGFEFIPFYFGVLLAGMVPIPLSPNLRRSRSPIDSAARYAGLSTIVRGSHSSQEIERRFEDDFPDVRVLHSNDCPYGQEESGHSLIGDGEPTAFIQYSSGTTAAPKGVSVTNANLLDNLSKIRQAFALKPSDVGVIWLPPYHDMGLIGGLLAPFFVGFPVYLMQSMEFASNPLSWLRAISKYKATVSGGPDTAYATCVGLLDDEAAEAFDLSQWRVAFNGAEPIKATTIEAFSKKSRIYGFQKTSFLCCYGLAEATLLVSATEAEGAPVTRCFDRNALSRGGVVPMLSRGDAGIELVSSGVELEPASLLIFRDGVNEICSKDEVGQIGVAGGSVANGYVGSEETRSSWQVREAKGKKYFVTGDYGFRGESDEIYVLGRWQDKMVVSGRNVYFADIEAAIEPCFAHIHEYITVMTAAVSTAGENSVALFAELTRYASRRVNTKEIAKDLRHSITQSAQLLANDFSIGLQGIYLLRHGCMPRTTSGKIQRSNLNGSELAKRVLLAMPLNAHDKLEVENELHILEEIVVAEIFREVLGITKTIRADDNFFLLGGDSFHVAQALHKINARFGMSMAINAFLRGATTRELALAIVREQLRTSNSQTA